MCRFFAWEQSARKRRESRQCRSSISPLIVDGPDLQTGPFIDALFEAGCDDATVGRTDGVHYIDFDREAESLGEAINVVSVPLEPAVSPTRFVRASD